MYVQPAERERDGRSASAPDDAISTATADASFVGREPEMAELARLLGAVVSGSGHAILISGDAGIGKTRLATEFSSAATARGALVLWGRCWEAGGAPAFWPWIDALRQAVASEQLPRELGLGRHGALVAELLPELRERLVGIGSEPPQPTDPESARFLMFDAVASLLRALAGNVPVVVVLDDLHFADQASLLLLAFAARTMRDARILLVGTFRDPDAFLSSERAAVLADLGRDARCLALRGLDVHDVGHLIARAAGRAASASVVARIHRATDGNPFFVAELLQLLTAGGRLDASVGPDGSFAIPHGVREAVRRRLTQLPSASIALLEVAAAIGREFDAALLGLASDLPHLDVLAALEEPVRLGLVVRTPSGAGRFFFRHALIREVLYEGLAPSSRPLLHRKLAESLELLDASDPGRHTDALAHHFLLAAPAGGDDRFIAHGARAARRALARMAFEEAVDLYQRTLDALSFVAAEQRTRCELLLALGEAKEWANDVTGSRNAFERAAAIARSLGARDILVEAALGVGAVQALKFTVNTRCESAPALLQEALASIDEGDTRSRARLLSRLALHHLSVCARTEALATSERAVATARASGDAIALGHALIARNAVLIGPDFVIERAAIAAEVLRLGMTLQQREFLLRGHALTFTVQLELGDVGAADVALEAHARLATETNDPFESWANLVWRGERAHLEGRFEDAAAFATQALALSETTPGPHAHEPYGRATFTGQMILLYLVRDDALPDLRQTTDYGSSFPEVSTWRVAALVILTMTGSIEQCRFELDRIAKQDFVDVERNGTWLATMSWIADAIDLVADRPRAARVYELLLPFADQNVTAAHVGSRGSVSQWLGILAATMGNLDVAEAHFEAALAMNARMGARPHLASTNFHYGRMLARSSDGSRRTRAHRLLQRAELEASALGMTSLARRCARLRTALDDRGADGGVAGEFDLRRDGDVWILTRGDEPSYLRHSKGMVYLAELLRNPGRGLHALDLVGLLCNDEGLALPTATREDLIDDKARRAYARRLDATLAELAHAETVGDPESIAVLRSEVAALQSELARATGINGVLRSSSAAERARISVTRALRVALGHITRANPGAGTALAARVRTGTYCCYDPSFASPDTPPLRPKLSRAESAPTHAPRP